MDHNLDYEVGLESGGGAGELIGWPYYGRSTAAHRVVRDSPAATTLHYYTRSQRVSALWCAHPVCCILCRVAAQLTGSVLTDHTETVVCLWIAGRIVI